MGLVMGMTIIIKIINYKKSDQIYALWVFLPHSPVCECNLTMSINQKKKKSDKIYALF